MITVFSGQVQCPVASRGGGVGGSISPPEDIIEWIQADAASQEGGLIWIHKTAAAAIPAADHQTPEGEAAQVRGRKES